MKKRRQELKQANTYFFQETEQKAEETDKTIQESVGSIEVLNEQIRVVQQERYLLIKQILQYKNDIEDTQCTLESLRIELKQNTRSLKKEEKEVIRDGKNAALGADIGSLATLAGGALGVPGLAIGGTY